jgi:hypothetical protein
MVVPGYAILEQHLEAVTADGHRRVVCAVVQASPRKSVTWQKEFGISKVRGSVTLRYDIHPESGQTVIWGVGVYKVFIAG